MPKIILKDTYIFRGKIFLPNAVVDVPQAFLDNRKEGEYTLVEKLQPQQLKTPSPPLALAILGVSDAVTAALVERYGSLEAIKAASDEDLKAVPGVGEATIKKIREA